MAITHKYTLLCDDIRQENNGKFIIVGLYTPDVVVPVVPFAVSSLAFFIAVESDAVGDVNFSFRLTQGATIMSGGSGKINIQKIGGAAIPLRLGVVQFPSAGPYRFVLDIEGSASITHEFSVILAVQNLPQVAPTGRLH
jgi:hypothetical protein